MRGGNTITITGAHFASGTTVNVGTNAATSVNVVSGSKLTAVAPAGSNGTVDVTVTTPQGGTSLTSSADSYTYLPQAGAVFAVDSGNTTGSGQLVQMFPGGPQTTLASGLNDPSGVAVDAAGDVFVVIFNSDVVEYPADGSGQRALAGGNYPTSLAVDAPGDVFVGDNHGVQEYPAGGGQVTLDPNIPYAPGLAVDNQGDVFVSGNQFGNSGDVIEIHPNGTQTTVASGLNSPQGLAVDLKGDVFIAEQGSNQVVEAPAGGGTPISVGSGLQAPAGVALDAAGNVFIADDTSANNVIEVPAGGGAQTTLASLTGPTAVAAYAPAPTFTADTPPDYAPVGKSYSYTYTASTPAGEPNATFALASGKLPRGLTLNPTTGVLSGTITSAGTYTFQVQTENDVQRSLSPLTGITTLTPTVTKVSPDGGPTAGGGTVTITGTGFVPGARVAFGSGNYATNVTYKSATTLTATAPAHTPAGVVGVYVLTRAGTSPASQNDLYAYGAPTVTKVSPDGGPTAGGGTVTITGTGFVPGARVAFGSGNYATNVTYKSATTLTATAPAHTPAGVVGVYVLTRAGTSPASQNDLYAYGAPTVTKVSPDGGPTAGGGTVTITGTGFVPGARVAFGSGNYATNVTYKSATTLTATAPAHTPAGVVNVYVLTARGHQPDQPGQHLHVHSALIARSRDLIAHHQTPGARPPARTRPPHADVTPARRTTPPRSPPAPAPAPARRQPRRPGRCRRPQVDPPGSPAPLGPPGASGSPASVATRRRVPPLRARRPTMARPENPARSTFIGRHSRSVDQPDPAGSPSVRQSPPSRKCCRAEPAAPDNTADRALKVAAPPAPPVLRGKGSCSPSSPPSRRARRP